ncbi:UDP-2,4-diacetamido-2,4,6-trideoxy-beta-L-altropyranose hydrolase [Desulfitobacterium sp. AusDCA]|uniref:UDP-2,4-diacetamido-2,4, 6-trideoxy-beta-L-altropyranose hydrolase n=1 Tax=Desulfitobacterium sp. AusDCA TaxID=3240383 RepID=UPI003DA743B0
MLIVIRADASQLIGSGHIMRCLTLAEQLKAKGADIYFICRDFPGNLTEDIKSKGYNVKLLQPIKNSKLNYNREEKWLGTSTSVDVEETASVLRNFQKPIDWLIVDHYGIDNYWESSIRNWTKKIMVIDDLANRSHDCELLLDQNLFDHPDSRYSHLTSKGCKMLLGPHYALLRAEFSKARLSSPQRDGRIQRVVIFYGGSDLSNETLKTLYALEKLPLNVDIIVGRINPNIKEIEEFVTKHEHMRLFCNVENMAQLMANADLAIGASGSTAWERCCLGLPMILITIAENQEDIARNLEKNQCAIYLGKNTEVSCSEVSKVVRDLMLTPPRVERLGLNAGKLVDGYGADRVSNIILGRTD